MSWPDGDPCPECGEEMTVGAVGGRGHSIAWEACRQCHIGWGPWTGYVETEGAAP